MNLARIVTDGQVEGTGYSTALCLLRPLQWPGEHGWSASVPGLATMEAGGVCVERRMGGRSEPLGVCAMSSLESRARVIRWCPLSQFLA